MPTNLENRLTVGIDPSLTATGVVLGIGNEFLAARCIRVKQLGQQIQHRFMRMRAIAARVIDTVDAVRGEMPITVYIEGYNYGSKTAGATLAEFGGILRNELLLRLECDLIEIPPKSMKKAVSGNGNADKAMIGRAIRDRWGVTGLSEDEADAFGLWRFGLVVSGFIAAETDAEREAVQKILAPRSTRRKKRRAN